MGAMRVVASFGLVSSSASRLLHRNTLQSCCAQSRPSKQSLCVVAYRVCCVPVLVWDESARARSGTICCYTTRKLGGRKSAQEDDHDDPFGGILAACSRMQTHGQSHR